MTPSVLSEKLPKNSQFGVFKEGSRPQRGHIGFYQNLVYIGKADRGEEEEGEGQEGKHTSQTRKKDVYQSRLKNDIRRL